MSTSRLVAALAAVAIGFGVTLVGVAVAEDPVPDQSVAAESAPETTRPVPPVESVAAAETVPTAPAETVATDAVAGDTVPVDSERSQSRDEPDAAEPAQGDAVPPPRSEPSDRSSGASSEEFPCSAEAFEVLIGDLSAQEQTALTADTDLFVLAIAKRLASAGTRPADAWNDVLDQEFDAFTSSGCADEHEQVFVQGSRSQFFCSAANMSADDQLFRFFEVVVPRVMTTCSYERAQGEN